MRLRRLSIEATAPAGAVDAAVTPVVAVLVGSVLSASVPDIDVSFVNPEDPPVVVGYRCVRCVCPGSVTFTGCVCVMTCVIVS